jgi:hypothetical protein
MNTTILAAAGLILGFAAQPASALPAVSGGTVLSGTIVENVQYRRAIRRPGRVCRVETIRRRTPRGVVITKVRRCR